MGTGSPGNIILLRTSRLFGFKRLCFLFMALPFIISLNCQTDRGTEISVSIKALTGLQYDVVRFRVKPGSTVRLTLTNVSDMGHNLIITKPGVRKNVVDSALLLAEKGPQMDFIPKTDEVLWSIPVISPGQAKSITFTAPAEPGIYPYVCTYPGHGFIMYGAMYVTQDETLPDIKNDLNIPESRRKDEVVEGGAQTGDTTNSNPHPYALIPPYF